jgi:hypothetical protein
MLRLLVVASLVSGFVACASAPKMQQPPPPRGVGSHAEIETLDNEIADQLVRLEIQPFTSTCVAEKSCTAEPPAAGPSCTGTGTTCENTCALGESICKNAAKICELAKQLGGLDAYANEKCTHGAESCTAARERCCNCKP